MPSSARIPGSQWAAIAGAPVFVLLVLVALGGCESIGYYVHVTGGQLQLLTDRQPVDQLVESLEGIEGESALRARLVESQKVLDFAEDALGLEVGGRYRSYVKLDRSAVVWNLFAAPPLSLDAHRWCYPFVGCAPYRGYFSRSRAERYQHQLEAEGLETHLGDVAAYSTLGWFDDPLLSTFIELPESDFIELLIHELAHSRIWIKDDAGFNESFAGFVGREGLREWLRIEDRLAPFEQHEARRQGWNAARGLLDRARVELTAVYARSADDQTKLALKRDILDATGACLEAHARLTGISGYLRIIPLLNNAYLASIATYNDGVPAFAELFAEEGGDWQRFYARAAEIGSLDPDARQRVLTELGEKHVATEGDYERADEIECEALSGHGFDGESFGAVHNHVRRGRHG